MIRMVLIMASLIVGAAALPLHSARLSNAPPNGSVRGSSVWRGDSIREVPQTVFPQEETDAAAVSSMKSKKIGTEYASRKGGDVSSVEFPRWQTNGPTVTGQTINRAARDGGSLDADAFTCTVTSTADTNRGVTSSELSTQKGEYTSEETCKEYAKEIGRGYRRSTASAGTIPMGCYLFTNGKGTVNWSTRGIGNCSSLRKCLYFDEGKEGTLRWCINKANNAVPGVCARVVDESRLHVTNDIIVSGACSRRSNANGVYAYQGLMLDGKAFYTNGAGYYIYYDRDCDGDSGSAGRPRWVLDYGKPDPAAFHDLDNDGRCTLFAYINSHTSSSTAPFGENVWTMSCDGGFVGVNMNIERCLPPRAKITFDLPPAADGGSNGTAGTYCGAKVLGFSAYTDSFEEAKKDCLLSSSCIGIADGLCDGPPYTLCKTITASAAGGCTWREDHNFMGIPTIKVLSELPKLLQPMIIDGRSSSGTGGGASTGVGVVLDGSDVPVGSHGNGLQLVADDVDIRGIAVFEFPDDGIRILGKRAIIRGGEFLNNGDDGISVDGADAIIGGTVGGDSDDADAIVVGGNKDDGIQCYSPRLTIVGTVYVGVSLGRKIVANLGEGIWLGASAVDSIIDGGSSSNINAGRNANSNNMSAIVIGGNNECGIKCAAPRLKMTGTIYVGLTVDGEIVANRKAGIYTRNTAVDLIINSDRSVNSSSPTLAVNVDSTIMPVIVIGGNKEEGIHCRAPRPTIIGNVFVGLTPQAQARGNKRCGIYLSETAANARIGRSIPFSHSSKTPTPITATNRIYIGANAGHGISCYAPGLAVHNTLIGLAPVLTNVADNNNSSSAGSARAAATATTTITPTTHVTTTTVVTPPSFGNSGDGIRLASTAVDARIGSTPFNQCSSSNGYMMCTTASCCEDAKVRFAEGTLDVVNITSVDECELAARHLQLQDTTAAGPGFYGKSLPRGCHFTSGSLHVNRQGDKSEPCGSQWRKDAGKCSTAKPNETPIFKCKGSSDDDAASPTPPSTAFPIRISSNDGAGISSAASRCAIANTIIGLGPSGEYKRGNELFGNNGDAGIVLEEPATFCRIGVDVEDRATPAVYISGNAGSGIQAAAPYLRVVNTVIGLEARTADLAEVGAGAAPNDGVAGIELLKTAISCVIGTSDNPLIRTWIAGNNGNGIYATDVSITISATDVGFNQQGTPVGNKGYGVLVDGPESSRPSFDFGSQVGASGYCGVRTGYDCIPSSLSFPGLTLYKLKTDVVSSSELSTHYGEDTSEATCKEYANASGEKYNRSKVSAAARPTGCYIFTGDAGGVWWGRHGLAACSSLRKCLYFDSQANNGTRETEPALMNGHLTGACQRCTCSTVTYVGANTSVVDCSASEIRADFGADFFSSMPQCPAKAPA